MGRVNHSIQARQTFQRCNGHRRDIRIDWSCRRIGLVLCRHREQGMLRRYALHVLRFATTWRCHGTILATWTERLLYALQNPKPAYIGWKGMSVCWYCQICYWWCICQLATLEKEVKERAKKETAKEAQEQDAPIINPGGFGNKLLLTQGG